MGDGQYLPPSKFLYDTFPGAWAPSTFGDLVTQCPLLLPTSSQTYCLLQNDTDSLQVFPLSLNSGLSQTVRRSEIRLADLYFRRAAWANNVSLCSRGIRILMGSALTQKQRGKPWVVVNMPLVKGL